jgi:DNA-binding GntR family transcriptional regulator
MTFKKQTGAPLYLQIRDHLLSKIDAGVWPEEAMIPTEAELCEQYNVSKITVREAVKLLVRDGRLSRIPGKGTFITRQKFEQKLDRFFSFTRWAQQNGLEPASRILKVETTPADGHIARHLGIHEGDVVIRVERLRLGNNEPLMFEVLWVPSVHCPDLHIRDLANVSLNDILQKDYGITLVRAVESIEPQVADAYAARLLAIQRDVLLLHVEHTAFMNGDVIAYFATASYRGDRVKFSIELKAE